MDTEVNEPLDSAEKPDQKNASLIRFNKTTAVIVVIAIYVALSLGYILFTEWRDYQANSLQQSFLEGRTFTIQQIIQQAENENCQPFFIFSDEKRVNLVNLDCLQLEEGSPSSN